MRILDVVGAPSLLGSGSWHKLRKELSHDARHEMTPFAKIARSCLCGLLLFVALHGFAAYPEKTIRFIIPAAAGSSPDVLMRVLMQQLASQLGVAIVVDNKPGGLFVIGTMEIVRAAPDGYTLGYGNVVSLAINDSLLAQRPYVVERDLTLIANCLRVANLLAVNHALPVKNVRELIEHAKRNPGKLLMGSAGNGSTGHLGGELFNSMTGIDMLHVPYKGSAQAINDLVSGEIHVMFDNLATIGPFAKDGRVRALAVSSAKRSAMFPDLPTIAEAGLPGYETMAWGGVIGPAKLPKTIIAKLSEEIRRALRSSLVQTRYRELGTEPDGSTPEDFVALSKRERPKWAELVRRSGAQVD